MHVITVIYYASGAQEFIYGDREADAKADFQKLETAIAEYRKFKNDTSETVTLSDHMGSTVFRVEHLISVSLNNLEIAEAEQMKLEAYKGRLIAAREASKNAAVAQSPQDTEQ